MQYEDFDVSIEATSGRAYRVAVLYSPAGEAQETVTFPFDTVALQLHLTQLENALLKSGGSRRRVPGKEEKAVLAFGQALFNLGFFAYPPPERNLGGAHIGPCLTNVQR